MKNKSVLIVDDNALNRKVFEHIIGLRYQFESAENGKIAIDKIRIKKFDLILMDIQMPVLNGISTLKIIRTEKLSDCPVIAISAFANENDRDYFLSTGFDDFIAKPIRPKNLLETIERHMEKTSGPTTEKTFENNNLVLDEAVVRQLLKYNSPEVIKSVYFDFLEEADRLLSEIEQLIKDKNFSTIGEKLHIIKGNSGTLGAMRVFNFTQSYEKNIKTSNFDNTYKDYLYLSDLIEEFKTYIQLSKLFDS
jgi:two-component system, OmpR family, alkaline phosphatase synthesis response regulator PhoP